MHEASPAEPMYWDKMASMVAHAELLSKPALADTGGVKGFQLEEEMAFRL